MSLMDIHVNKKIIILCLSIFFLTGCNTFKEVKIEDKYDNLSCTKVDVGNDSTTSTKISEYFVNDTITEVHINIDVKIGERSVNSKNYEEIFNAVSNSMDEMFKDYREVNGIDYNKSTDIYNASIIVNIKINRSLISNEDREKINLFIDEAKERKVDALNYLISEGYKCE